jgi:DNA-directed RNA polymerase subunit M/transcription elongation factor TFIIS
MSIVSYKDHFTTLLTDQLDQLLTVTDEDDKLILSDKHINNVIELIQLLNNQVTDTSIFDIPLPSNCSVSTIKSEKSKKSKSSILSVTKKQTVVGKVLEIAIVNLVNLMFNIVTDKAEVVLKNNKIRSNVEDNLKSWFTKMEELLQEEDFMWQLPLFDPIKENIKEDIKRARYKPKGTKGFGICKRCGSEELVADTKQTRSCDEGQTVKLHCVHCQNVWIA